MWVVAVVVERRDYFFRQTIDFQTQSSGPDYIPSGTHYARYLVLSDGKLFVHFTVAILHVNKVK